MTNMERWQLFMRDIESPDEYIQWGFFHLISSALQRRVWLYSEADTLLPCSFSLYPSEYIILVGPPSTGKGRVIAQESAIIKSDLMLDPDTQTPLIPYTPDKTTVESLTQHIAQSIKLSTRNHPKTGVKQGYAYCPCSGLIEELDVLFAQNTNDMVSVLVHCYDAHDIHYKTKHHGEDKIKNVCISLIAGTTQDSLRDLMNSKILKKGMASRCVFVFADKPRFFRQFPGLDLSQQRALEELRQHIKNLTKLFTEVVLSPEALEYHKKFYESGDMAKDRVNKDPKLDDYYGRKNIHWFKLCMVKLYMDQTESNVITLDMMKWAYNTLRKTETRMHEAFATSGRNVLYESCLDIERMLKDTPTIPYRKLWWTLSKDLTKSQFDECINLLTETGKIGNNSGNFYAKQPTTTATTQEIINGREQHSGATQVGTGQPQSQLSQRCTDGDGPP